MGGFRIHGESGKIELEDEHIRKFIDQGVLMEFPPERASKLAAYLESLPWKGTQLDWKKMPANTTVTLPPPGDQAVFDAFCDDRASAVRGLILIYRPNEAVVGGVHWMIDNLDELVWKAPGHQYLIGADDIPVDCQPVYSLVVEYDGADTVAATNQSLV